MSKHKDSNSQPPKMRVEACTYTLWVDPPDKAVAARQAQGIYSREHLTYATACRFALTLRALLGWEGRGTNVRVMRHVIMGGSVKESYYVAHFLVDGHE